MRINNNVAAFNANRNLSNSNMSLGKSLEKLSSGFRINRAGDDAAGLTISQGLRAQASGLQQATRNAQDGISVVQTAEGAMTEVHSMLNRMRDLAVQANNTGSNDATAIAASQKEFDELSSEITRISGATKFGTKALLDGSYGQAPASTSILATAGVVDADTGTNEDLAMTVNVGQGARTLTVSAVTPNASQTAEAYASEVQANVRTALAAYTGTDAAEINSLADNFTASVSASGSDKVIKFDLGGVNATDTFTLTALGSAQTVNAASGTAAKFQVGANANETIDVTIGAMDATSLGVNALTVSDSATITALDTAISNVSTQRSELGAKQNRFESTINNLQVSTENIVASESRIRDTDMATEMTNFTKQQILQQAGTAMLGQANSLPQGVLRLLG